MHAITEYWAELLRSFTTRKQDILIARCRFMTYSELPQVLIFMKAVIHYILFGFLCLLLPHAQAVEKITIHLDFIPDIEKGQSTFSVCARCHLPEAWGNDDGTYPQLAGQHVNVLMKQLLDMQWHSPFIVNVSICSTAYHWRLPGVKQRCCLYINPANEPFTF
jgi:hypothetical protein